VRIHYLDSSVRVKRYFEEAGSDRVHRLFQGKEALASSWLGCAEVSAAITRQARGLRIDAAIRQSIEAQPDYEWTRFLHAGPTQEDFVSAVDLTRKYALRGADAVHLAVVRQLSQRVKATRDDLIFWTADEELVQAGHKVGLLVENPLSL
jgi:predicted nucleic acid-binding protein